MNQQTIYLGGGCFWGLQGYIKQIKGVLSTEVGYANGGFLNPSYEDVCHDSGHVEALKVIFDGEQISLSILLQYFLRAIDPFSLNKQGGDRGIQYRTGIYSDRLELLEEVKAVLDKAQTFESQPFAIEVLPLQDYSAAEDYHQDYLDKNPGGYCHIPLGLASEPLIDFNRYKRPSDEELKATLSPESYHITQEAGTDAPFSHPYTDLFEEGVYVDITTGEPLFSSHDKFACPCGWPSFSRPIAKEVVRYYKDMSHGMVRTEVRSRIGQAHLGHVFDDGPNGGYRFCIDGSALCFISLTDMEKAGYGYLVTYIRNR